METVIASALSAIAGGGLATWFLQRWIGKKLDAAETNRRKKEEANSREWLLVKAYRQKLGRVLFWMITEMNGIMEKAGHIPVNGHLKSAWESFEKAETELKNFENEQAASLHKD